MTDTINRQEAINAVLRNLNEEKYRSSWESGAVKVMKDTLEKMPTKGRPVNGVLFKGRLEEGNYNLIKTTDGWVLKGETSYVGFNFIDKPQGEWIKKYNGNGWNDFWDYTCSNCRKKYERADAVLYNANYCPNCGADMRGEEE